MKSSAEYKVKVNKDCQVKLDTENWLPADRYKCNLLITLFYEQLEYGIKLPIHLLRTGGIEILAQKGKIKVDNTLEARLEMISQQILPSIRGKLFGSNPNRFSILHSHFKLHFCSV